MRNPFDARYCTGTNGQILMYEYTPNSVRCLAEFLSGKNDGKGVCPMSQL